MSIKQNGKSLEKDLEIINDAIQSSWVGGENENWDQAKAVAELIRTKVKILEYLDGQT